ncbi:protein DENND6B isoform X2 [Ixodes scapularis]|uniref:protein DENND6B isoform X2 n=1 Tax=Ixodes scapularis TaxID=6945 RepID=UPI001A9DCB8E|nr:protein DENND6B isoform X2 [Ixodes scapularis]
MAEDVKESEAATRLLCPPALEESASASRLVPWENFSNWVHCICVVAFDLELGQALEVVLPNDVPLSEKEKTSICYLAFPDSNSGCMGDTQFQFRIRQCPLPQRPLSPALVAYNAAVATALQVDPVYFHGYVYFRQVKDPNVRRGYLQKSLVVLTRLPLVGLFSRVLSLVAQEYFRTGHPSLEAACRSMDSWPSPAPGRSLGLPLHGLVVQARIPTLQGLGRPLAPPPSSTPQGGLIDPLPSVHEVDIFRCLLPMLSHVQLLWELVLVAEPVVVMASSPAVCSETVHALVGLIWPLRFCADYRPFFTIHDSEFKEYTAGSGCLPSVILGVTNPFFAKTLQHWPHVLRLGDNPFPDSPQKLKKAGQLRTLDSKPGLYTHYKPLLQKDKVLLKKLSKGIQTKRPMEVQSALLKRYLLELTQSFMIPLERYMASLMPLQRNISPYKGTPSLGPFHQEDFLRSLETSGPQLTTGTKGDWAALYRKFFRSSNFSGWYRGRCKEASQKLQALHAEAISDADLLLWTRDKQEVEVVDLVLRLKDKLSSGEKGSLPVTPQTMAKLRQHVQTIVSGLPEDLQQVLASSR